MRPKESANGVNFSHTEQLVAPENKSSPEGPTASGLCSWTGCDETLLVDTWDANLDHAIETTPLCFTHATRIWAIMEKELEQQEKMSALDNEQDILKWWKASEERKEVAKQRRRDTISDRKRHPGCVYYLALDGHIKIGWTQHLEQRLKAYPPGAELLASHDGSMETESHFHEKFKVYRSKGREWYKQAQPIMEHIERLRAVRRKPVAYRDYSTVDPKIPVSELVASNT